MIGMAAGAGMYLIATGATVGHFMVVIGYPVLMRAIPNSRWAPHQVYVTYLDGKGVLRRALSEVTGHGFVVAELSVDRSGEPAGEVTVAVQVAGKGSVAELADELGHIEGVIRVSAGDSNVMSA
jgi:putative Mg2+ transporter-C (MgtC) family protein